ncbi:MAG: AEC family transporter [Sphingomonadales bacterium]|nr:AEC family transporter [Sphingomonadales bacterium]
MIVILADALALLGIVAPVFLVILLGYGLARQGLFTPALVAANGRFVLTVLTPAVVFHAISSARIAAIFRPDYLAVYGLASLGAFALGFAWFRMGPARSDAAVAGVRAMGMSGSNTAFVGLPILAQLYGPAATGPIALNMLFESFVLLPLVLVLLELGQGGHGHPLRALAGTARNMARSSLLWAILLGTVCSAAGLVLPAPLERTVAMLASASGAIALVTIGASLAGIAVAGRRGTIAALVAGKLVLHPLLVVAALVVVPIGEPLFRTSAILLAALPMFSIFPVFGQRVGDGEACGAAMVVAVAACPVTVIAAMLLLGVHL